VALSQSQANETKDILTFATQEDFDKTLAKVNAMTKEERLAWEKEQGFKSFGTICDEFYATIQPENFKSLEEVQVFVARNSDKIKLDTDNNGQISCYTQEYDNNKRYLLDKNRMFIVGNKAYKSFENGIEVSVDASLTNRISTVKDYNLLAENGIIEFEKVKFKANTATNEDQYFERTEQKSIGTKNYRTNVRVEATKVIYGSIGLPGGYISIGAWFKITNQSQFIVWWNDEADTVYGPFTYRVSNGVDTYYHTYEPGQYLGSTFKTYDDIIEKDITPKLQTTSSGLQYIVSFEGLVSSTFTRSKDKKVTINVSLKYPNY
jgi:hypothetical protein